MTRKLSESVYFQVEAAVSLLPPPPGLRVIELHSYFYDGEEHYEECELHVVGIVAAVTRSYRRRRRSEFDEGNPHAPPSCRNLEREGYTFHDQRTEFDYLVHCDEDGAPLKLREHQLCNSGLSNAVYEWVVGYPGDDFDARLEQTRESVKAGLRRKVGEGTAK